MNSPGLPFFNVFKLGYLGSFSISTKHLFELMKIKMILVATIKTASTQGACLKRELKHGRWWIKNHGLGNIKEFIHTHNI